jgi:hypothetical protein
MGIEFLGKLLRYVQMESKWNDQYMTVIHDYNVGCVTIRYVDGKSKQREIHVPRKCGVYTFEEFSTQFLYELFVRTSIFSKVFGDFPQQIIAFTEENINLAPIDQPWFFGAISEDEANEILSSKCHKINFH